MKKKLIIVGLGTSAETVYKFIKYYQLFDVKGFAVNSEYKTTESFQGLPVYDLLKLDNVFDKEKDFLFVAVQWNKLNKDRRCIYERLVSCGYKFASIVSPNSIVRSTDIGTNCWISDHVVIESDVSIGNNVFIKTNASISHYSNIADHCFIGANSLVSGSCKIGEQSFVGVSSTLFDQVVIGAKCIIGAATIIKRNVPAYTLVKAGISNQHMESYGSETIEDKLSAQKNVR